MFDIFSTTSSHVFLLVIEMREKIGDFKNTINNKFIIL